MRWKDIEPCFHIQLEYPQNINCGVRYDLFEIDPYAQTLMNRWSYSYEQMELLL